MLCPLHVAPPIARKKEMRIRCWPNDFDAVVTCHITRAPASSPPRGCRAGHDALRFLNGQGRKFRSRLEILKTDISLLSGYVLLPSCPKSDMLSPGIGSGYLEVGAARPAINVLEKGHRPFSGGFRLFRDSPIRLGGDYVIMPFASHVHSRSLVSTTFSGGLRRSSLRFR